MAVEFIIIVKFKEITLIKLIAYSEKNIQIYFVLFHRHNNRKHIYVINNYFYYTVI